MRDRMRRRKKPTAEAGGAQEPAQQSSADAALQPIYPEAPAPDEAPETQDAGAGYAGTQAESHAEAGSEPPAGARAPGQRNRSRGRRRRKKPGQPRPAQPQPHAPQAPLQPAYGDMSGPRAPLRTAFSPGGPTGEAAELGVTGEEEPAVVAREPESAPAKRAAKGAVILSVGLPGSGKTTWFKRRGVTPLSSDLLRSLLFDDPTEQRHQDLVFSSLRSLLRARLMARMPQNYVDATNLSPKERRHWIRMARDFGYEIHAVYFDVPLQTCMDRNRRRQRIVPEDVMHRMAAKLRPPTFEEGFSKIIVVRVKQKSEEPEGQAEAQSEQIE